EIGRTIRRRRRDHPDQPVLLAQGQFSKRRSFGAHVRKATLVGDAYHLSGEVVGPCMVRAGEKTRRAAALGYLGAAVPAHIEERAQFAVAPAHDQYRHPDIVIRAEVTGLGPLRSTAHQDRVLAEKDLLLLGQMLGVGVDRHVIAPGRIGHGGGSSVNIMQQPLQKLDLIVPAHRELRSAVASSTIFQPLDFNAVDTVPYLTAGADSIRYRITIMCPGDPHPGVVQWIVAANRVSAFYFCPVSIRTLAQSATRFARRRGFSSKNNRLWPNKNVYSSTARASASGTESPSFR